MLEWLNRTVSKTVILARVSGVQIPPFPPLFGEMLERSNRIAWKVIVLARVPGVRIPFSPPSACGLKIKEDYLLEASGIRLKNVEATIFVDGKRNIKVFGDLAIDKTGISSTIAYTVSSCFTYCDFKKTNIKIRIKLADIKLGKNNFSDKIINVLSKSIDAKLVSVVLKQFSIIENMTIQEINKDKIRELLHCLKFFELNIIGKIYINESTTTGGIDLEQINPKTMESKICKDLYFCGEIIDVDGLIGGFNLQNCWSTGYIAGQSIDSKK